jgi:hypothetical protein
MWPSHSFFPHPVLEKIKRALHHHTNKRKEPKPLMCTQKLDERK